MSTSDPEAGTTEASTADAGAADASTAQAGPVAAPDGDALVLAQVLAEEYASLRPGYSAPAPDPATDRVAGAASRPPIAPDAEAARRAADARALAALRAQVHADEQPLAALSISGGGIRSATFALGAVQALARHGLLERFDYLSTVSGGGYLGGWLSAWCRRAQARGMPGVQAVAEQLQQTAGGRNSMQRTADAAQGEQIDPVGHLRDYNSYLTPKLGLLSGDTWALAAIILRNMVLNWLMLLPLLSALLLLPHVLLRLSQWLHQDAIVARVSGSVSVMAFAVAIFAVLRFLPHSGDDAQRQPLDYERWVWWPLMLTVCAYLPAAHVEPVAALCAAHLEQDRLMPEVIGRLMPVGIAGGLFLAWRWYDGRPYPRALLLLLALALLAAGTGVAAWLSLGLLGPLTCTGGSLDWSLYVTLEPPLLLLGLVIGNLLFVGLSSRVLKDEDREWLSRHEGALLRTAALWLLIFGITLLVPRWLQTTAGHALGTALATALSSGWLVHKGLPMLAARLGSTGGQGTSGAAPRSALSLVAALAPAVFIVSFLVVLALGLDALLDALKHSQAGWLAAQAAMPHGVALVVLLALALAALGAAAGWCVDCNTFSLHGMYRDRLVRAYLGASNPRRMANVFSGFTPADDLPMHELPVRPLHVVNTTLNVLKSNRLAWQQRKAQPFSISRLHCGNLDLGYRPTAAFGGRSGITLGTAITISGAAASPSMGAASTPANGFVMALLNARLGAWLGNPGSPGRDTWRLKGPRLAVLPLAREALGLTSNQSPYVYLSDGGHFENLALYEMVLRRCRVVVLLDDGCDPDLSLQDLGNALRKIRIDQGVDIEFAQSHVDALVTRKQRWAIGRIRYDQADGPQARDGWLLYVKPMMTGNEPPDVRNYGTAHPTFPHESTANQWFNESQTESYRALGELSIDDALRELGDGAPPATPQELARRLQQRWSQAATEPHAASEARAG